jgi:hypothetical protein
MLQPSGPIRYRLATILAAHWEAFVATYRGWIRPVIFETVRKILACQTPILGCHLYRCPCGEVRVVPHSCKSRFCPRCGKLATDRWADGVLNELLDVPYHHVIFSVPWQLRPVIAFNREVGLNLVVRAACDCLKQWARDSKGMILGMVAVIHTFGADIKWHPHVHMLVTEGGLSLDGTTWIRPYKLGWLISQAGLKKMWRYHCITAFRQAHRAGAFRFSAKYAFLKKFPRFNKVLADLYQLTWYVHIGAALLDPGATVRYIGRYTKRAVLAEYRITSYDGRVVRFRFKDYAHGGKISYKTLPVLAFLGRLIRHIPDKHFKMIRYAGLFATRWKALYLEQARAALGQKSPVAPAEAPASMLPWRERRQASQGIDPLLCRVCRQPMQLVAKIFGNHQKIADFFEAAGLPMKPHALGWQPDPG